MPQLDEAHHDSKVSVSADLVTKVEPLATLLSAASPAAAAPDFPWPMKDEEDEDAIKHPLTIPSIAAARTRMELEMETRKAVPTQECQIEIPFETQPSKLRLWCLWFVLLSLLVGAIVAVLYFGTSVFKPKVRKAPGLKGCGNSTGLDQWEAKLKVIGTSREQLEEGSVRDGQVLDAQCGLIRTSLGELVNLTGQDVTLSNIKDMKSGEDVAVQMIVGVNLGRLNQASKATRRSPSLAASLEDAIASGKLDEKLLKDWKIKVKSVILNETLPETTAEEKCKIGFERVDGKCVEMTKPHIWSCPEYASAPEGTLLMKRYLSHLRPCPDWYAAE